MWLHYKVHQANEVFVICDKTMHLTNEYVLNSEVHLRNMQVIRYYCLVGLHTKKFYLGCQLFSCNNNNNNEVSTGHVPAVKAFCSCSGTWKYFFCGHKEEMDPRSRHNQLSAVPVFLF